jgi:hypothetical protein
MAGMKRGAAPCPRRSDEASMMPQPGREGESAGAHLFTKDDIK